MNHAEVAIPHDHRWPQYGRCPRPVARHRTHKRRLRQADYRHREQLHPVRARPRRTARRRHHRGRCGQAGRRHRARVQHDRHRRRHRDGPRRHALLAAQPRDHRRLGRVHGQRAQGRRTGLHQQLRQDHSRHAAGRAAAEHPDDLRLGWPDGIRASDHDGRRHPVATSRPDRCDDQRRRSRRSRMPSCGAWSRRPAPPAVRVRACSRRTR